MKKSGKEVLNLLMGILLLVLLSGCGNKPDESDEVFYHTFTIYNHTYYAHKQLTHLEVTAVDGGSPLTADFVVNYAETRDVLIPIPKTGIYNVKIFSSDGQSMWWYGIALELPGNSILDVECYGSPVTFHGECAGISESGTNMTP